MKNSFIILSLLSFCMACEPSYTEYNTDYNRKDYKKSASTQGVHESIVYTLSGEYHKIHNNLYYHINTNTYLFKNGNKFYAKPLNN